MMPNFTDRIPSSPLQAGSYPRTRLRRNRRTAWLRNLVREYHLSVHDFIWPVFVQEEHLENQPVKTLPDVVRYSLNGLAAAAAEAQDLGISAIALFPVVPVARKSDDGREAWRPHNLCAQAISVIKKAAPDIGIICDVALDPYTAHGHDGVINDSGEVLNDDTIALLIRQGLALAEAGADILAPSDMMDGRIGRIRDALDAKGFQNVGLMSYAAKYASNFYGPFRDALGSGAKLGKSGKRGYQMDPGNSDEAVREAALDLAEGADSLIVKPGLPYLDIVYRLSQSIPAPIFAYQVSGEYAMLAYSAKAGCFSFEAALMESLLAFKRAGAAGIWTYGALTAARVLRHTE